MLAKKIGVCYNKRNKQFFEFSWMKKSMQKEELIMKITITAKKMQIPQKFTEYAEERLSARLDKFFGEEESHGH